MPTETYRRDAIFDEGQNRAIDAIGNTLAKNRAFNYNANLIQSLAPFMTVDPNGQIVYNGKPLKIQKPLIKGKSGGKIKFKGISY